MKKWFGYGGIAASVVLIAFGIGAVVVGVGGYNTVRDEITAQQITATPDAAELSGGVLAPGQAIRASASPVTWFDIAAYWRGSRRRDSREIAARVDSIETTIGDPDRGAYDRRSRSMCR